MVALGVMSAPSVGSADVARALDESRAQTRMGFFDCVQRGIKSGELHPETKALALTTVFDCFLSGVSISARDGADSATLDAAVTEVMQLWDAAQSH